MPISGRQTFKVAGTDLPFSKEQTVGLGFGGALSGSVFADAPGKWTWALHGCDLSGAPKVCDTTLERTPSPDGTWGIGFSLRAASPTAETAKLSWAIPDPDPGFVDADDGVCNVSSIWKAIDQGKEDQQLPLKTLALAVTAARSPAARRYTQTPPFLPYRPAISWAKAEIMGGAFSAKLSFIFCRFRSPMSAIWAASSSAEWRADSIMALAWALAAVSRASWSAANFSLLVLRISEALRFAAEPLSLSEPLREDGDAELGDVVEDRSAESPFEVAATALLPEEIQRLLAPLDEREREILKLRFGLDRGEPRTLEEVGEHFNLTRERIRQIEARAMSKLRHPSSDTGARDLLAV